MAQSLFNLRGEMIIAQRNAKIYDIIKQELMKLIDNKMNTSEDLDDAFAILCNQYSMSPETWHFISEIHQQHVKEHTMKRRSS